MTSTPWLEGIEVIVFRTVGEQPGLWESILPVELRVLPCELARVDALLDDPAFLLRLCRSSIRGWVGNADGDLSAAGRRIQAAGGAIRTRGRDRSRSAGKRAHAIAARLRLRTATGRDEVQVTVRRITGELAGLAERAARDAQRLLVNARWALARAATKAADLTAAGGSDPAAGRRRGRLRRAVNDLMKLIDAAHQIAAQTRQRVAGITPDGASRRVSLHDGDARPIVKGRLGKPVEFGAKA
jgi:IS5 family transposase